MILATAWCGIVYALIGGQPMMINGGTGPVLQGFQVHGRALSYTQCLDRDLGVNLYVHCCIYRSQSYHRFVY
jgi:hypothetical protein